MEYIEGIILAFGTPVVMIAVIAFLVWFNKKHTLEHRDILQRLDAAEKLNSTLADNMNELYKMSLRSCIVNTNIPVSARLELYDVYKSKGFNSWIDEYVDKHLLNPEKVVRKRKTDV